MKTKKNRKNQLQDHVQRYKDAGNPWPAPSIDIARWAIETGLCIPEPTRFEQALAREISRALREDYFEDPQGRKVRRNHPFPVMRLQDGELVQTTMWGDMPTMRREQMVMSLQLRRQGILADCRQLDTDRESYNENYNPGDEIQTSLNFEEDIEESKHPVDYSFDGYEFTGELDGDDDEDDEN